MHGVEPAGRWLDMFRAATFFNRLGIALLGPLQRLLRRQIELCEQFPNRRQAKSNAEFALDQVSHHLSGP
jgi:hypothetical protein